MATEEYGTHGASETDVAVVREIYEAFRRRDVEAALEHVSETIELIAPGTAERAGRTSPYLGHEGVREYFADVGKIWDELEIHADDVRATVGSVVVFGHVEGVVAGERLRRRVIWTWRLREGKAAWLRVHDVGPGE